MSPGQCRSKNGESEKSNQRKILKSRRGDSSIQIDIGRCAAFHVGYLSRATRPIWSKGLRAPRRSRSRCIVLIGERTHNVQFSIDYYGPAVFPKTLILARRSLLQVREAFHFSPPPGHRIEHKTCDDGQKSQQHEPSRKHRCWKARN